MLCTGCAQESTIIAIRMRIGGEEVTFRRCARCESNVWEGQAGRISLDRVLDLARAAR